MLNIEGFIWEDWVVEKLDWKHGVDPEQVEGVFFTRPYKLRRASSGKYLLYGQTEDGRYLFIVFVWVNKLIKVISARDMTESEQRFFKRK